MNKLLIVLLASFLVSSCMPINSFDIEEVKSSKVFPDGGSIEVVVVLKKNKTVNVLLDLSLTSQLKNKKSYGVIRLNDEKAAFSQQIKIVEKLHNWFISNYELENWRDASAIYMREGGNDLQYNTILVGALVEKFCFYNNPEALKDECRFYLQKTNIVDTIKNKSE